MILLAKIVVAKILARRASAEPESRQLHLNCAAARGTFRQAIASHRLDPQPIVTAEFCSISMA
jgi:hypothetical protein